MIEINKYEKCDYSTGCMKDYYIFSCDKCHWEEESGSEDGWVKECADNHDCIEFLSQELVELKSKLRNL